MMSDRVIQIGQNYDKSLGIKIKILILNDNLPGQVLQLLSFCKKNHFLY